MYKKLSLSSLVFLMIAAINSIRNLPSAALFGSSLLFFYLFGAIVFLLPVALVAAELSSRFPKEGGIFHWVRNAFGEKVGLLAIWLQWVNTIVWYPTILAFLAGTVSYLFNPSLATNPLFITGIVLLVFWSLTLINFLGLQVSARINTICSIAGTLFPMLILIIFGMFWILFDRPIQISFHWKELLPSFTQMHHWISLVAIIASLLGMELSGVYVNELQNPRAQFPRAVGIATVVLITTMVLGSLSIAIVIPSEQIQLVDGVMQAVEHFFSLFHIPVPVSVLALFIVTGTFGSMISWLISPAQGLLHAARCDFLPSFFNVHNKHGVPTRILLMQATLVSIFCCCFILLPNINAFYWFFTTLSTQLYLLMYILMFAAALKLGKTMASKRNFFIGNGLRKSACILGIGSSILTISVGFFPPPGLHVPSQTHYALGIAAGCLCFICPVFGLYGYRKWKRKNEGRR